MNKRYGWVMGIAIVVVIAIIVGVLVAGKSSPKNNTNMNMPAQSGSQQTKSSQPAKTNDVSIQNMAFSPSTIQVPVNTIVSWTNHDAVGHTVTADSGGGPASGIINQGNTYEFTFSKPGTYHYHCSVHPNMTGTVIVTQ